MVWVFNGKAEEFSGIGKEAPVGSKIIFKLKHDKWRFSFVGFVKDTSTIFEFVGLFEKVNKTIKELGPYTFFFHDERGSIKPELLSLKGVYDTVSLKRHSEGKWEGNIVKVKDNYALVTALTCKNAGSGLQKIFNYLTDEGY